MLPHQKQRTQRTYTHSSTGHKGPTHRLTCLKTRPCAESYPYSCTPETSVRYHIRNNVHKHTPETTYTTYTNTCSSTGYKGPTHRLTCLKTRPCAVSRPYSCTPETSVRYRTRNNIHIHTQFNWTQRTHTPVNISQDEALRCEPPVQLYTRN